MPPSLTVRSRWSRRRSLLVPADCGGGRRNVLSASSQREGCARPLHVPVACVCRQLCDVTSCALLRLPQGASITLGMVITRTAIVGCMLSQSRATQSSSIRWFQMGGASALRDVAVWRESPARSAHSHRKTVFLSSRCCGALLTRQSTCDAFGCAGWMSAVSTVGASLVEKTPKSGGPTNGYGITRIGTMAPFLVATLEASKRSQWCQPS